MPYPWFARMKGHMRSVVPSRCAVCGSWPSTRLCEACVARFAGPEPRCTTCARVLPGPARQCGECILTPPPLDQCLAAVRYAYPWSDCITRFKFDDDPAWVGPLAALLRSAP
jgi:predicted amidophosphoribosyltransferase